MIQCIPNRYTVGKSRFCPTHDASTQFDSTQLHDHQFNSGSDLSITARIEEASGSLYNLLYET